MEHKKALRVGSSLLFAILLLVALTLPAGAFGKNSRYTVRHQQANTLNVNVYVSIPTLQRLFQNQLNQLVPAQFNQVIANQTQQLPPDKRDLASQLAGELLQPSATLTQLIPQQDGLAATISLGLYPGDTAPTNLGLLVGFHVGNGSTIQISGGSLNGSPSLVSGNLTTLAVPLGQLNGVNTTPGCGAAGVMMNLAIPAPGQGQQAQQALPTAPAQGTRVFIEIPATSLNAATGGLGSIPLVGPLSARNIQIAVQDNGLMVTSDIFLGPAKVATAHTSVQLAAANGGLAATVIQTTLSVAVFSLSLNLFNQRIEQMVNQQLNGALGGKLTITSASFGPTNVIPCAANDSLLLTSTIPGLG